MVRYFIIYHGTCIWLTQMNTFTHPVNYSSLSGKCATQTVNERVGLTLTIYYAYNDCFIHCGTDGDLVCLISIRITPAVLCMYIIAQMYM